MARQISRKTNSNVIHIERPEKPKRKIRIDDLKSIQSLTVRQETTKKAWKKGNNLLLSGLAGTGKTYLGLGLALEEVLDPSIDYNKLIIIRSIVPTRNIGFLKGDDKEKIAVYEAPYKAICEELFDIPDSYDLLKEQNKLEFVPTSFIRGSTFRDAIVIVDEMENLNFHELDSVITRVGENTKIIFCGDYHQSDFTNEIEKKGILKFIKIIKAMNKQFTFIEFDVDDIVRSDLVKSYIIAKYELEHG